MSLYGEMGSYRAHSWTKNLSISGPSALESALERTIARQALGGSEAGGCIFLKSFRNHLGCRVSFIASVSGSPENLCCLVLELMDFRPIAVFQLDSSKLPSAFCVLRRRERVVSGMFASFCTW